jgi:glutamine synthetase
MEWRIEMSGKSEEKISKIIDTIKSEKIEWIRLQFCDPFGILQQISVDANDITEESFSQGMPRLDGSSIKGFKEIQNSDMLLAPDPNTFAILPEFFDMDYKEREHTNYRTKAARFFVNINEGYTGKRYSRDSRYIAEQASDVAKNAGFDKCYFGPEVEFFIFDKIVLGPTPMSTINWSGGTGYSIESREAPWSTDNASGYIIPVKGGYYPAPPADSLNCARDEIGSTLSKYFGIHVEAHHHEVATAGQGEIQIEYDELLPIADSVITLKKTTKEVAAKRGRVANFMPKPLEVDNGSAMHISQSLWTEQNGEKKNTFYDPNDEYAELSQTAHYYIGGLLEHAPSLCAITNPTTNSYRRLVPGFEAPTNLAWSRGNRSACIRIPSHHKNMESRKRIESRIPDPSANIYLAQSAMLLAGLDGIKKKIQPPDPVDMNIYKLSEKKKRELGIKKLPVALRSAIDELESDDEYLKSVFTADFLESYCEIKQQEHISVFSLPSPREFYLYSNV